MRLLPPRWKLTFLAAAAAPLMCFALPARGDAPGAPPATATAPLPAPPSVAPPSTAPLPAPPPDGPGPQMARGRLDWQPGLLPPLGYRVIEKRPWPFVTGLAVFGSSWGLSVLLGGIALGVGTNKPAAGVFLIPVLGPFIDLAWQKMTTADAVFTGVIGGLQALGAASLIAGIVLPKRQKLVPAVGDMRLSPVVTPQVQGVGLTGSF